MIHINDHCVLIVITYFTHSINQSHFVFYVDIIIIFVIDAYFIVNLL